MPVPSQGQWLVRIEDTDIPRIYPGSEEHILRSIDAFQFEPDAEIISRKIASIFMNLSWTSRQQG